MPKARVTKTPSMLDNKYNPIVRERDNTSDLQDAEQKVHTRMSKMTAPAASSPGRKVSAPPHKEGTLPS